MKINAYLDELQGYIPQHEKRDPEISKVDIGWQIDHSLRVLISINRAMQSSNVADYHPKFSLYWLIFKTLNWLPRGKGRSPKVVRPDGEIDQQILQDRLNTARNTIKELASLPGQAFFPHPYFGHLRKKQAIRFMEVHTFHHLKIIRDIAR